LRLSSNAGTTRGLGVGEFQSIGRWIDQVLRSPNDALMILAIRDEVRELCRRHSIY